VQRQREKEDKEEGYTEKTMGAGEMTCQPVLKVMPRWQMKKKGNLF
jgi:hypothetical protein